MKKNLLVKALIWTIAATVIVLSMDSAALREADLPPAEEKQIEALIAWSSAIKTRIVLPIATSPLVVNAVSLYNTL